MKTAIFLGAGASKVDGAPLQSELFEQYFQLPVASDYSPPTKHSEIRAELINYFQELFAINLTAMPSAETNFPTFEEVLGVLDLAELRREGFRNYDGNKIRLIREYIVMAMAIVIDVKLRTGSTHFHRDLISHLGDLLPHTTFISTNYDILIDHALMSSPSGNPNYGIEFENFATEDWVRPGPGAVNLYKLHGSLNWLFCPICNNLILTVDKIVEGLLRVPSRQCLKCESTLNPIIVPPTFFKDMSRVFLSEIWNKAEQALRRVDRIIFCGYSFPDADMHIKYLLKRIQVNRVQETPLRFIVINGKHDDNHRWKEEKRRYQRFLGKANVNYEDLDFESFCESPQMYLSDGAGS